MARAIGLLRHRGGDPAVRAAVAVITERLAAGLAGLVNVLNPDRILLGGLHRYLLEADPARLRAAVADRSPWGRAAASPWYPPPWSTPPSSARRRSPGRPSWTTRPSRRVRAGRRRC